MKSFMKLLFRRKEFNLTKSAFQFLGTLFWAPIPVNWYDIYSGFDLAVTSISYVFNIK